MESFWRAIVLQKENVNNVKGFVYIQMLERQKNKLSEVAKDPARKSNMFGSRL